MDNDQTGSDAGADEVADATRSAEEKEAEEVTGPDAGRAPTAEEAAAAERAGEASPGVAEAYRDMTEKGADAKGEGELP